MKFKASAYIKLLFFTSVIPSLWLEGRRGKGFGQFHFLTSGTPEIFYQVRLKFFIRYAWNFLSGMPWNFLSGTPWNFVSGNLSGLFHMLPPHRFFWLDPELLLEGWQHGGKVSVLHSLETAKGWYCQMLTPKYLLIYFAFSSNII